MSQLDDREIIDLYQRHVDYDTATDVALEAYGGAWPSAAAWAEEHVSDAGLLEGVPEALTGYIDYAKYAADQERSGYLTFARHPRLPNWVVVFSRTI